MDPHANGFICQLTDDGFATAFVYVEAELDIASAPHLERVLRDTERRARFVLLDLGQLTFMDSFGLRVIVAASRRAQQAGRRLVVLPGPSQVQRLFVLSGAAEEIEITERADIEPALAVLLRVVRGSTDGERMSTASRSAMGCSPTP
jgi:anti-sigma B factor antagonist